jgi:lysophospholipase L1-like esterase
VLKKILWFSILFLSSISAITLSAGFYQVLTITGQSSQMVAVPSVRNDTLEKPVASSHKKSNSLSLLIMGDSIANGTGDETGKGFAYHLSDYLKKQTPKEIVANNIGIDGLHTNGLLERIRGESIKPALAAADLMLISIGGNDLRQISRLRGMEREDGFQKTFDSYVTGLRSILRTIRKTNSDALIIFIGLYYPSLQDISPDDIRLFLTWNEATQKIIEQERRAIFIPTYDLFKLNMPKYIALDAVHPNAAGYQAIANRIGKSIEGYFNGKLQSGRSPSHALSEGGLGFDKGRS